MPRGTVAKNRSCAECGWGEIAHIKTDSHMNETWECPPIPRFKFTPEDWLLIKKGSKAA